MREVPQEQRCCVKHLWGKCQGGAECKFGARRDQPTEGIKTHKLYIAMLRDHGEPKGVQPTANDAAASARKE